MKIAWFDYVFNPNQPGTTGLSDVVWNCAEHQLALGDEVHIIAPYAPQTQPPAGVITHDFPLPPLGYRNILGHILIVLRGWQIIRRLNVDIIHAPEYLSTGLFARLGSGAPVILTAPGNIYERIEHGNPFDPVTTLVFKVAASWSARYCRRIIAISHDMKMWWERIGAAPERVTVLSYGVDLTLFAPVAEARPQLGLNDETVLLYVGRFSPEKGLLNLLEAVAQLRPQYPKLQLHLAGEGPQQAELEARAKALGLDPSSLVWLGWQPLERLPLLYSAADICVLPSLSEPLGRVMLEALACGRPFVGANVGGIVDHIVDRQTGYLFNAGDTPSLTQTLAYVLNNPEAARQAAQAGQAYVRREWTWPNVARRIREEVYLPALAEAQADTEPRAITNSKRKKQP